MELHDDPHRRAVEEHQDGYVDPTSGLFVFTETYLASRPCCGNGCRHCPWKKDSERST